MGVQNVLIIDPNQLMRAAITEALSLDYKVEEAACGDEAIDMLTGGVFDLVILEVDMPGTSGWETLRVITDDDSGWPKLPVIVLTTLRAPELVLKAWTLGADFWISKPFSVVQLLEVVTKVFAEVPAA